MARLVRSEYLARVLQGKACTVPRCAVLCCAVLRCVVLCVVLLGEGGGQDRLIPDRHVVAAPSLSLTVPLRSTSTLGLLLCVCAWPGLGRPGYILLRCPARDAGFKNGASQVRSREVCCQQ